MKEKTADEMFEELGYKSIPKEPSQIYDIKYYKDDDNVYYFHFDRKSVAKSGEYDSMCDNINMQELQAINEKVKELRMDRKIREEKIVL